jgi:hypothetical protein
MDDDLTVILACRTRKRRAGKSVLYPNCPVSPRLPGPSATSAIISELPTNRPAGVVLWGRERHSDVTPIDYGC